jgi:hypothetical protein
MGETLMTSDCVKFHYTISFQDGRYQEFLIELDPDSLALLSPPQENHPDWTRLACAQCPNCPLDPQKYPHCPIARNLAPVIDKFARNISHEEVNVTIETHARDYHQKISLQNALRSLFGIYMVTSGCPVMDPLRPLVLTHLPFATMEETSYRVLSMYMLAQFFILKNGGKPDWDFKNLGKIYQEIEIVNRAFHERLGHANLQDASLNAIGNLNCYAQFTQMLLEPGNLKRIEKLFAAYL